MRRRLGPRRTVSRSFSSPLLTGVFLLSCLWGWRQELHAQAASVGNGCEVPHFQKFTNVALSNGSRITYFSAPTIVCSGDTRITADSAVVYEATSYTQFFRNVVFEDTDSRLTAQQAHYFDQERRLRAWGGVILTDRTEGSIIRGDTMVLLRTGEGRVEDQLTVLGRRPTATLYPTRQPIPEEPPPEADPEADPETEMAAQAEDVPEVPSDSTRLSLPDSLVGVPPDSLVSQEVEDPVPPPRGPSAASRPVPQERKPYEIEARRIFMEGSRYLRATGEVTIVRDSVNAAADSVEYDQDLGALFLAQEAHLVTSNFDLAAERIRLDIPQDEIREVLARHNSVLEGEDLRLLAPTIRLFLTEGRLERLVARRDSLLDALPEEALLSRPPHPAAVSLGLVRFPIRPHAYAQDFLLWADSIEVLAPGEALEEVWAMGDAQGESMAGDTLNTASTPEIAQRDWLAGDTVIAVFVPDTVDARGGEEPVLEVDATPLPPGREAAPADSSRYRLDRLIARVGARSLYRMAASDSTQAEGEEEVEKRLAIHYVVGDEITIHMLEGEVEHMEVTGATQGIHLEPVGPGERRRRGGERENASPAPDPVPPDTALVRPGRGGG